MFTLIALYAWNFIEARAKLAHPQWNFIQSYVGEMIVTVAVAFVMDIVCWNLFWIWLDFKLDAIQRRRLQSKAAKERKVNSDASSHDFFEKL